MIGGVIAHPAPVASSKAATALALAVIGLLFSPLVGGVIPAAVALQLADQARADIESSDGFLTGHSHVGRAIRLAWIAIWVSLAASATLSVAIVIANPR